MTGELLEWAKWAVPTIIVPLYLWGRKRMAERDAAIAKAAVEKERSAVRERETAAVLEGKNTLILELQGDVEDYQQAQLQDAARLQEMERVNAQNSDSLRTLAEAFRNLSGSQGTIS